ncbi:hypothetical protein D5086_021536 [Populus alba]|uniref:Uncharacterized protein n=1 Tax=Populus alba TaxID=43335 RepID=A0ACC4BCG0_POPAL
MAGTVTSNSGKKLIHSDVCSDTTWQCCFVGKRNLDKAIAEFKDRLNLENLDKQHNGVEELFLGSFTLARYIGDRSDADLASDLASEVAKINIHLVQQEEAMKKSRELLFAELCKYLALDKEEVKRKWSKMDQEEKRVLIKGFVDEWGVNFHPLSARSVKEMIEEYLHERKPPSHSSGSMLFPGLKRIMGFSQ